MSDVTVVIPYTDPWWAELAESRAMPSARTQGAPVVLSHGPTVHEARNNGLALVETPRVIMLDADDELEPGYLNAMAVGAADVRVPMVRYVRPSGAAAPPVMPRVAGHHHACVAECLQWGNWVVIGASVPTSLVRKVGGFRDYPWSEDWHLWSSIWLAGGTFEPVPRAIYRAHVRRDSRNRAPGRDAKLAAHRAIATDLGFPVP